MDIFPTILGTSTIADGAVTLAKLAALAQGKVIGRSTTGTGVPEAVTVGGGLELPAGGNLQLAVAGLTPGVSAPIGYSATVVRTADSAARNSGNTGATLTNDDASGGTLQFAIGTSSTEMYLVEGYLLFNGSTTADVKVGWNATGLPSGATAKWGASGNSNATAQPGYGSWPTTTTSSILAIGGTLSVGGAAAADYGVAIAGIFFGGGTAGNIVFAWAQATADASNVTHKAGSMLRVTKLRA